mmetsp:Transcript_9184/g.27879  ORF Transcript_9184/g.27879 Transcript_9184/m.27879 type:complete len:103 (-) Transcript_9184:2211-2519(-)
MTLGGECLLALPFPSALLMDVEARLDTRDPRCANSSESWTRSSHRFLFTLDQASHQHRRLLHLGATGVCTPLIEVAPALVHDNSKGIYSELGVTLLHLSLDS